MTDPIDIGVSVERLVRSGHKVDGIAVGIDAVDVTRMKLQLAGTAGEQFVARMFTEAEVSDCRGRPERFAARWAAKEAVAKAIGTGFRSLRPNMIEILKSPTGQPSVRCVTESWPSNAHQWQWEVSMTHDGQLAIAVVVALTGQITHAREQATKNAPGFEADRADVGGADE